MATRRTRLMELVSEDVGTIHDEDVRRIVDNEALAVPRFALLTAEDAYRDNPNLTLHHNHRQLEDQASGECNEEYAWTPQKIVDLETGEELDWRIKVEITTPKGVDG